MSAKSDNARLNERAVLRHLCGNVQLDHGREVQPARAFRTHCLVKLLRKRAEINRLAREFRGIGGKTEIFQHQIDGETARIAV